MTIGEQMVLDVFINVRKDLMIPKSYKKFDEIIESINEHRLKTSYLFYQGYLNVLTELNNNRRSDFIFYDHLSDRTIVIDVKYQNGYTSNKSLDCGYGEIQRAIAGNYTIWVVCGGEGYSKFKMNELQANNFINERNNSKFIHFSEFENELKNL